MLLAALLLANTPGALAQTVADARVQVEVIIFEQADPFDAEGFAIDPELSYPEPFRLLGQEQTLFPTPVPGSHADRLASLMVPEKFLSRQNYLSPTFFIELEKPQRQLNPDAYTLGRSGHYRVLVHTAWQQPVAGRSDSPWIVLHGGRQLAGHYELEGSIRVFKSRFSHVETFLWLSRLNPPDALSDAATSGNSDPTGQILLPPVPQPRPTPERAFIDALLAEPNPSPEPPAALTTDSAPPGLDIGDIDLLRTSEQIRTNTPHYIDHPRLGVLLLVTPIESDGADEPETDDYNVNFE